MHTAPTNTAGIEHLFNGLDPVDTGVNNFDGSILSFESSYVPGTVRNEVPLPSDMPFAAFS